MQSRWTPGLLRPLNLLALDVIQQRWAMGTQSQAEDTPLDEWRDLVEKNLTGVFITCMAEADK
ncbi:MAG: hypothetical protein CM15mP120_09590 [Pseudomonadota bacterium]|nr:MAG: hypothetical protein CM15mP120_09590 [Pseudomonadota bacterium]